MKKQNKAVRKISDKSFQDAFDVKLSDSGSLRIQMALKDELSRIGNSSPKPIMTILEAADYLRMPQEKLEDYLGDIPCFELGGKLLFRKDAVDEWIKGREKGYSSEVMNFNSRKFTIA